MKNFRRGPFEPKLRGRKLEAYGQIMARERQSLFVDEARRAWILMRYPPDKEWGVAIVDVEKVKEKIDVD